MSRRDVDYNKLDKDALIELELDGKLDNEKFQRMNRKRKFDDGTFATKSGKKKEKVQRGGKDTLEFPEDDDE